jgi:hypothetical protein
MTVLFVLFRIKSSSRLAVPLVLDKLYVIEVFFYSSIHISIFWVEELADIKAEFW